jgi:hypothetical protein
VTLNADIERKLRQVADERGQTFDEALNDAVRAGLRRIDQPTRHYRLTTYPMGVRPDVNLDQALGIAGEIEDDEVVSRQQRQ